MTQHTCISSVSLIAIIGMLILEMGCSTTKPAQKKPTTQDQPKTEMEDAPRVYNPSTGNYEPVENPMQLIDTVEFREDKRVEPVKSSDEKIIGKKSVYEVAFLVPFETEDNSVYTGVDPKVRRFVHYYGGVKMALQDLADRGVRIAATIYDTQDSPEEAKRIIQKLDQVDAVVGPYEAESLRDAAEFSSRKKVPVFSPWTPSIPLEADHPRFVQLIPGLEAHAIAMVDYIDAQLGDAHVYMVARNDAREKARLDLFRDAHAKNISSVIYEELIIEDASMNLSNTVLSKLLDHERTTVFILPYFSRNDEDFVGAFLRKLHAEKETQTVYVFGMPQWLTFNKLNPDYLESASVHISTAHFMDSSDPDVRAFQERFFALYGTIPEPAAHQGYVFVNFLGEALHKYGTGFLDAVSDRLSSSLQDGFDLVPVYRNPVHEKQNVPNYLENQAIHILRFTEQAYRRVE